jgi:hypothetical protein
MAELAVMGSLVSSLVAIANKAQAKSIVLSEICAELSVQCFRLKEKIKIEHKILSSNLKKIKKELKKGSKGKDVIASRCYREVRNYQESLIDDFSELILLCIRYEFINLSDNKPKKYRLLKDRFNYYVRDIRETVDTAINADDAKQMLSSNEFDDFYEGLYGGKVKAFKDEFRRLIKDLEGEVDKHIDSQVGIWDKVLENIK